MTLGRRIGFGPALAAVSVVGLALRLTRLGAQSFWIDEVLSFAWIGEIDRNGPASLLVNIHGPLHAAVLWLASRVSTDEAWLRLPSALAGAAAVPALGLLGRTLFGPAVGLAASVLLAVSPFALYYAQECRNYAFTILFATALLAAAWGMVQRPTGRRAAALGVAELASVTSNLNGLFLAIGVGAWGLWMLRRDRRGRAAWLMTQVLVVACLVPYAWRITHQVRPERLVGVETDFGSKEPLRGTTTLHPLAVPYTAFAFAAGYSLGPTLAELRGDPGVAARPRHWPAVALVALGFGVPFVAGLVHARRGRALLIVPALVVIGFTVWLAATNVKPYNVRYLSVALPAFLMLVAAGWWRLGRRLRAVTAAAALGASLWSCANYLWVPRYGRDDVRGAVAWVAARAGPEDAIVQIALTAALRHYYTELGSRPVHPPAAATSDLEAATAFVRQQAPPGGVVWYLECRPEALDPTGVLRRSLQAQAARAETTDFVGVRVHRFTFGPR
jgi:hypothetical protein